MVLEDVVMGLMLALLVACGGCGGPAVEEAPPEVATMTEKQTAEERQAAQEEMSKAFKDVFTTQDGFMKVDEDLFTKKEEVTGPPKVFFDNVKNGDRVKSPVYLRFGVQGMKVRPAGVLDEGTGHHHLIIDRAPIAEGTVIPMDDQHIHYGKGQTRARVELTPGSHTLQLQFANGAHQSYGPEMAAIIRVLVE